MHTVLAEWLVKNGYKTAYMLSADYAAGQEANADFKATYTKLGGQIVGEAYFPLGNNDFAPYLSKVIAAKPQVLFGFYGGSDAVKLVQQAAEYGLKQKGILLAGAGFNYDNNLLPAQGKAAIGAISAMHWANDMDTPLFKKFAPEFQAKYGEQPNTNVVNAYDAMVVLASALEKVKGNTADKDAFLKAIASTNTEGLRGKLQFDPNTNQVIHDMYVREVREVNGTLINAKVAVIPAVKDAQ